LWVGAAVVAVGTATVIRAQSSAAAQTATPPQFKSGVSILRLDASVVDDGGRAIGDLKPEDFQVTIDGQPRKVLFAHFTGSASAPDQAPPAGVGTHAVKVAAEGRAIALVVDLGSIRLGNEAPLLDTAAQLVDKLRDSDAIGLIPLPGQMIDLTRDRPRVAQTIRTLRGTSNMPMFRHSFTFEEAVAYAREDKMTIEKVIERECSRDAEAVHQARTGRPGRAAEMPPEKPGTLGLKPLDPDTAPAPAMCPMDLKGETRERIQYERSHIQTLLSNLVTVATQLRTVRAPTTIVLISGGLAFDQESYALFEQAQRAIRDRGLGFYAVQVDQPETQASDVTRANASFYSSTDRAAGLSSLATMAGGTIFQGIGRAKGVFERLRTEITEAYELGVEPQPGDIDGKPHEVKVTTTRKADVHARRYVTTENPPSDPTAHLANLIAQPVDVGDLPIAIAAHSVRGDEATTLKVMIRADIGHGVTTTPPVRYQAVVIGANGNAGVTVTGNAASDGGVVIATQLAPGRYRVRLAAVEAGGRAGTLEVPIVAGLRSVAGFQLGDLIVGTVSGQALMPSIYASAGSPLIPTLEMTTPDAARFAQTNVAFEVRRGGSDDVVATGTSRLEQTQYDRQQIARGTVPTSELPPGEYTLSAVIKVDGQAQGRVSRTFVLEPAAARSAPAAAAPAAVEKKPEVAPAAPVKIADPVVDDAMHKAASYVASYGEKMSAVVGVEKYIQNINPTNGTPPLRPRQIIAEFALVKSGGAVPWTGYRDVIEVNGDPITDRRDRIVKILTESANPLEEAARLTAESARFNVGPVSRNFNVPTTALFFFNEANLSRFAFTKKGTKKIDGIETLEITFKETKRPTLITTRAGKDVPCEGTVWVLPTDGTIVRTRLQLRGFSDLQTVGEIRSPMMTPPSNPVAIGQVGGSQPAPSPAPPPASGGGGTGAPSGGSGSGSGSGSAPASGSSAGRVGSTAGDPNSNVRLGGAGAIGGFPDMTPTELTSTADIEVTYRRDEKLGMWLPAQMTEEYQGAIPQINRAAIPALARSKATYSDYKQFGTSSTVIGVKK
jgi:VWFA-related protein